MKLYDLDPEDPTLTNLEHLPPDVRHNEHLGDLMEGSDKFFKAHTKAKNRNSIGKEMLRRILTKKNFFPDKADPELLTWMEMEMMKHLAKTDPGFWDERKLSDGFPATVNTVKKVLKGMKKVLTPRMIEQHDEKVRKNWQLLAKGKLEITPELQQHLKDHYGVRSFEKLLPSEDRLKFEKKVIEEYKKSLTLPEIKPGKFGNLIADYNRKVAAKEKALRVDKRSGDKEINAVQNNVLTPATDPQLDGPNPERETAMLNVSHEIMQNRRMTLEVFRKEYLDANSFSKMLTREEKMAADPSKVVYEDWLEVERTKDAMVTKVEKLDADKILKEEIKSDLDAFLDVPKYVEKSEKPTEDFVNLENVESDEDNIKISSDKFKPGCLYRVKDSFYDDQGEFLYRIPTETIQSEEKST